MITKFEYGIDPGKITGIARRKDGQLDMIFSTDFWGAYDEIKRIPPEMISRIVIEISNTSHVWHTKKGNNHAAAVGARVGQVKREGQLLAERFEKLGYVVQIVPPTYKKLNGKDFERITGWQGRTSQHGRDSAMLMIYHYSEKNPSHG